MKKNLDLSTDISKKIIVKQNPKSPISEQYRVIRTNIEFAMIDSNIKALVCTSSKAGEGKSTTIANLAVAFANAGTEVVLVDADLRKPTAHLRFNVENHNGLTKVLTKNSSLAEAVVKTDVNNLWLLPSGPTPPNPTELLGSNAMQEVVKNILKEFDLILFESPPVLIGADAQILGNLCDGALLIVESNATKKEELLKAKDLLDKANVNVLGVVLNKVKRDKNKELYYYGNDRKLK